MFKRFCLVFLVAVLCFSISGCSILIKNCADSGNTSSVDEDSSSTDAVVSDVSSTESEPKVQKSKYWIASNSIESFDLAFLSLENESENKIYSPLSIKYALKMLEEGATGQSKAQISGVIGNYKIRNYTNSKNMSFANAMFIKDTYKSTINKSYVNALKTKYNALVKTDSFKTPDLVNSWVSKKTLGLIKNPLDDISQSDFILINALGIDMEWKQKFITHGYTEYQHMDFYWSGADDIVSFKFKGINQDVSGMDIIASLNNYNIVKELGEANIRKTVTNAYKEYIKENNLNFGDQLFWDESEGAGLTNQQKMDKFLDNYIKELNSNYKAIDITTDFSFYTDDNVKVFAKDLKKYNGTTLQYIGIMPTKQNLQTFISNTSVTKINYYVNNLKDLRLENFKKGVVTKITGNIPKFKFEYDLNLMADLKKLGITNVFEKGKANLTNISSDKNLYINNAKHKANIEFTQDGIKVSAATTFGGLGAAGIFDYLFDVPVEEIDLTFDKPYMFIIRDKNKGDVWFVGTVYTPLLYADDTTTNAHYVYEY